MAEYLDDGRPMTDDLCLQRQYTYSDAQFGTGLILIVQYRVTVEHIRSDDVVDLVMERQRQTFDAAQPVRIKTDRYYYRWHQSDHFVAASDESCIPFISDRFIEFFLRRPYWDRETYPRVAKA